MAVVYLGLGSNIGDRVALLRFALAQIAALPYTKIEAVSPLYESAPWGVTDQPAFYNAAARITSEIAPQELLQQVKQIEHDAGRREGKRWGPRPLDIDILLYGAVEQNDPTLTIPHPRMWQRRFVLEPLAAVWQEQAAPQAELLTRGLADTADQDVRLVAAQW